MAGDDADLCCAFIIKALDDGARRTAVTKDDGGLSIDLGIDLPERSLEAEVVGVVSHELSVCFGDGIHRTDGLCFRGNVIQKGDDIELVGDGHIQPVAGGEGIPQYFSEVVLGDLDEVVAPGDGQLVK